MRAAAKACLGLAAGTMLAAGALAAQPRAESLLLGPRLLYYPVECGDARGCRIDCYQSGVNVFSRIGLSKQDDIRLVMSSGLSDDLLPRWIEIRPAGGESPDTVLLTRETLCDLQSLVIKPVGRP